MQSCVVAIMIVIVMIVRRIGELEDRTKELEARLAREGITPGETSEIGDEE